MIIIGHILSYQYHMPLFQVSIFLILLKQGIWNWNNTMWSNMEVYCGLNEGDGRAGAPHWVSNNGCNSLTYVPDQVRNSPILFFFLGNFGKIGGCNLGSSLNWWVQLHPLHQILWSSFRVGSWGLKNKVIETQALPAANASTLDSPHRSCLLSVTNVWHHVYDSFQIFFPKMTGSDFFTSADPLLSANNSLFPLTTTTSSILAVMNNRVPPAITVQNGPPSPPWDDGNDIDIGKSNF